MRSSTPRRCSRALRDPIVEVHRQAFVHHPAVPPLVEELRAGGYAVAVLEERAELPRGQMVYPEPFRH